MGQGFMRPTKHVFSLLVQHGEQLVLTRDEDNRFRCLVSYLER